MKPLLDKRNATLSAITKSPSIPEQLIGKHYAYHSETRRCRVCGEKEGTQKHTFYNKCVGRECFMKFHTAVDYFVN